MTFQLLAPAVIWRPNCTDLRLLRAGGQKPYPLPARSRSLLARHAFEPCISEMPWVFACFRGPEATSLARSFLALTALALQVSAIARTFRPPSNFGITYARATEYNDPFQRVGHLRER